MRLEVKILSILLYALFFFPGALHAQQNKDLGLKTVVIDPGHGGKDPGAVGKKYYAWSVFIKGISFSMG